MLVLFLHKDRTAGTSAAPPTLDLQWMPALGRSAMRRRMVFFQLGQLGHQISLCCLVLCDTHRE